MSANTLEQSIQTTILALNKSFTKKIVIGIEQGSDNELIPIIRILGKDFVGIKVTHNDWNTLKGLFPMIQSYFDDYQDDETKNWNKLECQEFNIFKVYMFNSYSIKFEEVKRQSDKKDKFYQNVIMQKNSFEMLERLAPCIDMCVSDLFKKIPLINAVKDVLVNYISVKMENGHNAQILEPNDYELRSIIDGLDHDDLNAIEKEVRSKGNSEYREFEIKYIINELRALHYKYIAEIVKMLFEHK